MNKWPRKVKKYKVPIYGGDIAFCRTAKDYVDCSTAIGVPTDAPPKTVAGWVARTNHKNGRVTYLICVFTGGQDTLIHELAHAAFMILHRAEVPVTRSGANEAYCYLLATLYSMAKQ